MQNYISKLIPGDIIPAKVTHLEQFGAFVDIGCGIPSLIPIDAISISRISHPVDRFVPNQDIKVIIKKFQAEESGSHIKNFLEHGKKTPSNSHTVKPFQELYVQLRIMAYLLN
jgi:transcriptional accessory protein Tex/SPT6